MDRTDDRAEEIVLDSLELIDSQRQLAVLYQLQTGDKQFDELLELVTADAETLSDLLDELQSCGFVERKLGTASELETNYQCSQELTGAEPGGSDPLVSTTYALTPKGDALEDVFDAIESWGAEYLDASDQPPSQGA